MIATPRKWLAWKIGTSDKVSDRQAASRPMTFLQAAAFQWVNPKAWAMALGAVTTYAPEGGSWTIVPLLAGTFMLVGAPCSAQPLFSAAVTLWQKAEVSSSDRKR